MAKKKKKKKKKKTRQKEKRIQEPRPVELPAELEVDPESSRKKRNRLFLAGGLVLGVVFIGLISWFFLRSHKLNKIEKPAEINVLLITLDTTRADRLGCYGYDKAETPNLDFLANNGVRFENVYCQVPLTTPSHCTILTGTYPLFHRVHNNGLYRLPPQMETIAEILSKRGFETAAFVASFTVDSRFGLDQGFKVYDDTFVEDQAFKALNSERKAEKVYQSFAQWLENRQSGLFFCWIHFFDPHLPYEPPPPYQAKFSERPYDGEIAYMDKYIGKIIEILRSKDLLSKTLLVLAGDHGEAFGEKEERGHGIFLYDETLKVPLILYAEKYLPQGLVIKSRVRLIDILPTILDFLNLPIPQEVQGVTLLPYIQGKRKKDLSTYIETYFPQENYGWSPLIGVIDGDWKYIKAPKEELYNLRDDPHEERNLIELKSKIAQKKRKKLENIIAQFSSKISVAEAAKRVITKEEREKLRSLGYVDYSSSTSSGSLPDPKDMVEELRLTQQAEFYESKGQFAEAAQLYEKMLSLRPNNQTAYASLALMYAKLNKFDQAVNTLLRGVSLFPNSIVLLSRLAHTYLVMGRLKKSLDVWEKVLKIEPNYFDGLLGSAWILDLMGRKEEALKFYEKALEIEPENKFLQKNYARALGTSGHLLKAIQIYEKLKENYPDDYEVLEELGIAYGYAGDLEQAIENLSKSVELHPTPLACLNLAVAYRKKGDLQKAVKYFKLYLANSKGESKEKIDRVRKELAFLEKQLGRGGVN